MNPMISRTLKALCTVAVAALLSACGASSTVDPFVPTRVIGLGDGYNDIRTATGGLAPTVREGAGTVGSVVEQVAAYFGQSNVMSVARSGQKTADLATQILSIGSFSEGDLVVITVGMHDVIDGTGLSSASDDLINAVQSLLDANVKHVLIMPVLEVSKTPWGVANSFSATATGYFNANMLTMESRAFGGRSPNPVIYANYSNLGPAFLLETTGTTAVFTDHATPACGDAALFAGCTSAAANASYTTMLFADGIHLTPAGNRWVAQFLYNATAQGWR